MDALAVNHFLHVAGHALDRAVDELSTAFGRSERRFGVRLVGHGCAVHILGKCCQSKRGFELLGMSGQVVWLPMSARQQFLTVFFCVNVPVREEVQIDLILPHELVPGGLADRYVSAVSVQHEDVLEAGANHAIDQVGQY